MENTVIEALRAYFLRCPLMGGELHVDYLPEDNKRAGAAYSIDPGMREVLARYMDGGEVIAYSFGIRSAENYGADAALNMKNSGFFERLGAWMREKTRLKDLPELPEGMEARAVEAVSAGCIYEAGARSAKYRIECRLVFYKKGEKNL